MMLRKFLKHHCVRLYNKLGYMCYSHILAKRCNPKIPRFSNVSHEQKIIQLFWTVYFNVYFISLDCSLNPKYLKPTFSLNTCIFIFPELLKNVRCYIKSHWRWSYFKGKDLKLPSNVYKYYVKEILRKKGQILALQ